MDIGLGGEFDGEPALRVVEAPDAARHLPSPGPTDDKYTRGVVGVVSGSTPYPGAAVLSTGSARLGGSGMVRYAGGAPEQVIANWPEVVIGHDGPANAGRVQAWVVGPGAGTDAAAAERLAQVLADPAPALVDADALTLLASQQGLRQTVAQRHAQGQVTVLTPHEGEFARLGYHLSTGAAEDRVAVVRAAASDLGAVVLLKGSHTVVAEPDGAVFVNTTSASTLATAGSGDVLSGLAGSMLAVAAADQLRQGLAVTTRLAAEVVVSAAFVHGLAGIIAGRDDLPVVAHDILDAVPDAIAAIRGSQSGVGRD
ncbi:MAG: NAD(P)H-hydrate dehydratase [Actinomycetes bacterium]